MLRPVHEETWLARGGSPAEEPWNEIEFTDVDEAPTEFIAADCLTMNTGADGFLVSQFAHEVLCPLLGQTAEFLPVRVFGQPYSWLNCLASVTALDRRKTDADWSVIDGGWGSFSWISTTRRLAFLPRRLEEAPVLFRIPEYPQGILFAREELKSAVEDRGLTGFKFDLVWSMAQGGVADPPGVGLGDVFVSVSAHDVARRRQLAQDILAKRTR